MAEDMFSSSEDAKNSFSSLEELKEFFSRIKENLVTKFPELFGIVYTFAKKQGWNLELPVRAMFQTEGEAPGKVEPSPAVNENAPVQFSQTTDSTQ